MIDLDILQKAANESRGLAIDAIASVNSGHLGLPLGCAEIGAVLFSKILKMNPKDSKWLGRDRFILSAGHGSMFLYNWLSISGFDVSLEDLANFRRMHSKTPGHPEFGETDGVETSTGPLGQGIANAVGFAVSAKMAAAKFGSELFDHSVFCLAGDGCFQEGISFEACSIAGHLKLDNLVLIYDSNEVTLDAMADKTSSVNFKEYFSSLGFSVYEVDGHNIEAVEKVLSDAKAERAGKPKIVIAKTTIAKGIAEVEGTAKGHGEGGAKFVSQAKERLGLPQDAFYLSAEVKEYFNSLNEARVAEYEAYNEKFENWALQNPELAKEVDDLLTKKSLATAEDILAQIPEFALTDKSASRVSGGVVLNAIANVSTSIITSSADLYGSTKNYINKGGDFSSEDYAGRNLWYGIREHAMAGINNGIAYDGFFMPASATFLTFAGYMLGSMRISALAKLPVQFILTHDSIGVGFDGPTHQPVETVALLRCIPNLQVLRPADSEETAAAFAQAYASKKPTALILSRQDLPIITALSAKEKRDGTLKGAYVVKQETQALERIIIASGSEVSLALEAGEALGAGTRVVSMPSMDLFESQSQDYKNSVLPECADVIAIEAGSSMPWQKYANKFVCTDEFGFSADGPELFEHFGFTVENIVALAKNS
ncbi:MAG: transketolase [Opitutales bacterium]